MIIVLTATRYQKLAELILNYDYGEHISSIGIIKEVSPRIYFYVETSLPQEHVIYGLKKAIVDQGCGVYLYELYGVYNGKIDYSPFLSEDTKNGMKYYQTQSKDITEEEILKYKAKFS